MLDRAKMLEQLQTVTDKLFKDFSAEYDLARASFNRIIADPNFKEKIKDLATPWMVPEWAGALDAKYSLSCAPNPYTVLAVDGSQIYPDRHQGTGCFLVNIGSVTLCYGASSRAIMHTQPFVFTEDDPESFDLSPDVVNAKRQELEFTAGIEQANILRAQKNSEPFLFLFDGSLIFWHLESKEASFKELYLGRYINALQTLYQERTACAGYISMPKSKELVSLIRIELCNFRTQGCTTYQAVDHLLDTNIASFFLREGQRSNVFKSGASISSAYPEHLKPYFFYLHVGDEIGRVEIPAWMAQDEMLVNQISTLILDQAQKGSGYPVALAEAHEQAVVKGPDREFFYQVITKFALEKRCVLFRSQKSMKKRGLGV